TLMVMAAYNMGYGHLQDARELCESLGKDPNRWIDLESVLPLLSQRKYYKNLKHGYARGYEAIDYINRVRVYWDILQQSGALKNTHK
ncbi:MAG: lytic transglycosylase F, partial [Gammaproteobacteria bacterium]|nr:lytic transglycosylase F [Gammaproteobacteria bacterium]